MQPSVMLMSGKKSLKESFHKELIEIKVLENSAASSMSDQEPCKANVNHS